MLSKGHLKNLLSPTIGTTKDKQTKNNTFDQYQSDNHHLNVIQFIFESPKYSQSQITILKNFLNQFHFFQYFRVIYESIGINRLLNVLKLAIIEADELLFTSSKCSKFLYLIVSGSIHCIENEGQKNLILKKKIPTQLAFKYGEIFKKDTLLGNNEEFKAIPFERFTLSYAIEKTYLLYMDIQKLSEIEQEIKTIQQQDILIFLQKIDFLEKEYLPHYEIRELDRNQRVYLQNQKTKYIYWAMTGSFTLSNQFGDEIAIINPPNLFGVEAYLYQNEQHVYHYNCHAKKERNRFLRIDSSLLMLSEQSTIHFQNKCLQIINMINKQPLKQQESLKSLNTYEIYFPNQVKTLKAQLLKKKINEESFLLTEVIRHKLVQKRRLKKKVENVQMAYRDLITKMTNDLYDNLKSKRNNPREKNIISVQPIQPVQQIHPIIEMQNEKQLPEENRKFQKLITSYSYRRLDPENDPKQIYQFSKIRSKINYSRRMKQSSSEQTLNQSLEITNSNQTSFDSLTLLQPLRIHGFISQNVIKIHRYLYQGNAQEKIKFTSEMK